MGKDAVFGFVQPFDVVEGLLDTAVQVEYARAPELIAEGRDYFHPEHEDLFLGQVLEQFAVGTHCNSIVHTRPVFSIQPCEDS